MKSIEFNANFGVGLLMGMAVASVVSISFQAETPFNSVYDQIPQTIYPISLKANYDFAGEALPLQLNDVAERLEREMLLNTYQHSSTILHLKLSARYFPTIERIFAEENIPADLKYLAVAESSLRNSTSPSGAKGIWQFLPETGREFGLEINEFVDERNHFEKSTRAAVKYLKQLRNRFGSWTLAAAAYNMGPTALQRAMAEQRENDYYRLNLSEETNRYIFRIVAAKEVMKNPEKFGFFITDDQKYVSNKKLISITVDSSIANLGDFVHQFGFTYRDLKIYNPWLMKSSLPNKSGKTYTILFPSD